MSKKKNIGRPTEFTQEIALSICDGVIEGKTIREVCSEKGMPVMSTVFKWLTEKPDFSEQWRLAKELQTEALNEKIIELGDVAISFAKKLKGPQASAVVQAVKLKSDNLKWSMSKMKPKKYGDKVDVTSDGKAIEGNTLVIKDYGNSTTGS